MIDNKNIKPVCNVCGQPYYNQTINGEPAGHYCFPDKNTKRWSDLKAWVLIARNSVESPRMASAFNSVLRHMRELEE